jgi:hypothetical protein
LVRVGEIMFRSREKRNQFHESLLILEREILYDDLGSSVIEEKTTQDDSSLSTSVNIRKKILETETQYQNFISQHGVGSNTFR